jgi:hypothetical protein
MSKHRKSERKIRIRSKPLAEVDQTKLALALWLMAKRTVEEEGEKEALTP